MTTMFIKLENVDLKMLTATAYDNNMMCAIVNACRQIMKDGSTYTVEAELSMNGLEVWQLDALHVF